MADIRRMAKLRDILKPRPRILFVGINPSIRSEQVGHHFASPGNPFWRLMYASRLVPVELTYEDDARLLEFDLALTSLCPRATRSAAELSSAEMIEGQKALARRIRRVQPQSGGVRGSQHLPQIFWCHAGRGCGCKGGGNFWRAGVCAAESQRTECELSGIQAQVDLVRAVAGVCGDRERLNHFAIRFRSGGVCAIAS